jgi:hypothetical protein
MTTGYSGRPLAKKMGIKESTRVVALQAPEGYPGLLEPLPEGVTILSDLPAQASFIHFFSSDRADLEARFPRLKTALDKNGTLWISWPKKASGAPTDLTGDVVRQVGLANGLVDVKVCAVDETWSGLKFVYRLEDR